MPPARWNCATASSKARWSACAGDGLVLFDRRGWPVKINEFAAAAIAGRGGDLNVAAPTRVPAMALAHGGHGGPIGPLPAWMCDDWLVPVTTARGRPSAHCWSCPSPAADAPPRAWRAPRSGRRLRVRATSPPSSAAIDKARQLARSRVPVLLLGETGVGKEEFARGIHEASPSAAGTYVALNCGGLSRDLLASELFGYAEGAFTGARKGGLMGKIEAADGGTLFLDEIDEMLLDLQPHLLRVLEEGKLYRLGENTPRKVNFRLVAATHRNLRERGEDIAPLAELFLERFTTAHRTGPRCLDPDVLARLHAYSWPGNVRELRNAIESMVLMSDGELIGVDALPPELAPRPGDTLPLHGVAPTPAQAVCSMAEGELELIRRAIAATGGNLTGAARQLGVAKSTLYLKLKRYRLEPDRQRVRSPA
ncbi:sigma-54 interaction domain-containing protein [Zoogloea sp.]|uniref:sigma-54 interaction domain-containing protein n=1 Tax=Zoogloea sp. TaxID=49181 RepID=UPI0035AF0621